MAKRLARGVLALAAAATATAPRGFLLVATKLPVQLLQRDADVDWRRDELCRRCTRRTGRDPCAYLLWHNHRKKREEHKSPRTTACGYHAPPHELILRHQHHGHASSPSPAG